MNSVLNIQVKILANQARSVLNQLNAQMLGLGSLGPANSNIARVGSQMQWLGRQLEYNFTLPLLAAGTAATKFALDNEKAFTRITKVYGDAAHGSDFYAKELESLRKAFIALSNEFGVAQDDALNIAADWAAAGASGLALAKSVELTLKTMVLGELQASDATNSLIAIQAQYGLSIAQLSDTIDILNMVENQTGISMGGLIAGFARVAGVARASGVGVRELAADLAALTPATGSAANAGNALKTIFSRLLSPTKDAAEVLKLMGINVNSFAWQSSNAQERLLTMAKTFGTLSDAQKGFVSSIIASRYQVNRFEQLMVELASDTGYYARALQSTRDMNAVYTQSQKELNQVLSSNPQRLKIIWTMLQNASADIIQPLIPLVLWLASAIQNLVTSFSNLNPGLQKFILFGLAFIALVGPVIRYVGALTILFSQLGGLLRIVIGPFKLLFSIFSLGGTAVKTFFTALSTGIRTVAPILLRFAVFIPWLFRGLFAASAVASRIGFGILQVIWNAGAQALATGMSFGLVLARNVLRGSYLFITVGSRLLWTNLVTIFSAGAAAAYRVFLFRFVGPIAAASGVLWRTMLLGPVAFFRYLGVILASGFRALIPLLTRIGLVLFDVLTGPWGIAITAILILIAIFWKDIKQIWTNIVNWFKGNNGNFAGAFKPLADAVIAVKNLVVRAFNALPAAIRNAMIAVVDVIAAAAKAVYKWFSYLNPWAKHSPSLIDNVKTGADAIKGHYSSTQDHTDNMRKASVAASTVHASGVNNAAAVIQNQTAAVQQVGQSFNSVTDDVDKFEAAIAKVQRAAEQANYDNIRKQLQSVAADAIPAYDQLIKDLYPLEDQLKVVGKQLDAQKSIVDGLKDSLGNANDALDEQTKILDGMKNSMAGLDDQIASLNGGLEVLRGSREQLRQAGAGSDILGNYDAQIQQLQDQKNGINDQLQAAQTAYNQQKTLVDQLTASRDALQASYDLESKKLDQIQKQYDAIRDKISAITDAINSFKSAADSLASAKSGGKNDLIGSQFGAGAGANFADVGGKGGLGREGGIEDQSKLIDEFTKSIQDKTKNLFGLFNFLDPIKKAWGVAWKWVADTFGPIVALIGNFFSHLFDNVPNPFAGGGGKFKEWFEAAKGWFEFLTKAAQDTWKLIGPPITEIVTIIRDKLGKAFKEIGPELAQYKDLIEPIGDVLKNYVLPILKVAAGILIGVFLLALNIVLHVIKDTLPPIWDTAIAVIKNFIKFFRGIAELFYGIITGRWSLALKGLKDIFVGAFMVIWSLIKGVVLIIWGIIKGLVEGIVGFFTWAYDELVGHSIIPDLVNGIIKWFKFLVDVVKAIWNALGTALSWIWDNIISPIVDRIKQSFKIIADVVAVMVDEVKKRWQIFKDGYSALWDLIKQVAGWIKDKFNEMKDGINNAISIAKGYVDSFITKLTGIKDQLKNAFVGVFDGLKDAFKSAVNWIIGKWNDLSFGVGPFKADTPDIPFLARGGMIANKATAIVGEGRRGYPEYVIPTDPNFRGNALALFNDLGEALGIGQLLSSSSMLGKFGSLISHPGNKLRFFAGGGVLGRARLNSRLNGGSSIIMAPTIQNHTTHFHGNLEFPNVKDGKDAKEFVKNLKALVG